MEQNVRFSVASIISDHAVLQRDEVIPVHGRGRAGARVRAELTNTNGAASSKKAAMSASWLFSASTTG